MTDMQDPRSPSPKPKEPGSYKRILTTQAPLNTRPHPTPLLQASGPDGSLVYSNPNHNPANNVIPRSASRELQNILFQVKKVETQYTKVDHHITFLSSPIDENIIPTGLKWNITVNVMESNNEIEKLITEHPSSNYWR